MDGGASVIQQELFEERVCFKEVEKFRHGRSLLILGL
jgi:hypothetical protein